MLYMTLGCPAMTITFKTQIILGWYFVK